VLIADSGDVDDAVRMLIRIGLDRVVHWVEAREVVGADGLLCTHEVEVSVIESKDDAVVLDVRNASEFGEGHIPGATNVAYLQLSRRLAEVPTGSPIYVHCRSGVRSARAVSYLNEHGFEATNITGGFMAWEAAGYRVVKP